MHIGVRGVVSTTKGEPLHAVISVENNAHKVKTDSENGDYYRLLLPGTYQVTASSEGFHALTHTVVIPAGQQPYEAVVVDFELQPL